MWRFSPNTAPGRDLWCPNHSPSLWPGLLHLSLPKEDILHLCPCAPEMAPYRVQGPGRNEPFWIRLVVQTKEKAFECYWSSICGLRRNHGETACDKRKDNAVQFGPCGRKNRGSPLDSAPKASSFQTPPGAAHCVVLRAALALVFLWGRV